MNLDYLMNIRRLLDHVETNMAPVIEKVAEACADCGFCRRIPYVGGRCGAGNGFVQPCGSGFGLCGAAA